MNDMTERNIVAKIDRATCEFEAQGIKPWADQVMDRVKPQLTEAERDWLVDKALWDLGHANNHAAEQAFNEDTADTNELALDGPEAEASWAADRGVAALKARLIEKEEG